MDFITSLLTEWGYLALFIIMTLENMNIPIPSEIVLGFAGFLVFKGVFAFWPTILIGTAAGLTGSLLSYWMGYKGGRKILLKFSTKGGLTTKKLIAADSWFQNFGVFFRASVRLFHFPQVLPSTISENSSYFPLQVLSPGPCCWSISVLPWGKTGKLCYYIR